MEHWYAVRKGGKTSIETESEAKMDARIRTLGLRGSSAIKGQLTSIIKSRMPVRFPIHEDMRAGRIRPSVTAIKKLASQLDRKKGRRFHVIVPPVYPACLLIVPFGPPPGPTAFSEDRAVSKSDLDAAMQQFEYDLARRSVTHAILCELPRARNVDELLRRRGDCTILNAPDANARTLVFVLWCEPQEGEPLRINEVDEPASPLRPLSDLDPGIVWAETADAYDAIVASDPDRYEERLVSATALACFK